MYLEIDNEKYKINVIKKARNKNTYIRVNDDLEIVVTTNIFTTSKQIVNLLKTLNNMLKLAIFLLILEHQHRFQRVHYFL